MIEIGLVLVSVLADAFAWVDENGRYRYAYRGDQVEVPVAAADRGRDIGAIQILAVTGAVEGEATRLSDSGTPTDGTEPVLGDDNGDGKLSVREIRDLLSQASAEERAGLALEIYDAEMARPEAERRKTVLDIVAPTQSGV